VLLHYLVVPGLGDSIDPRSQAPAVRAAEVAPADCGDAATATVAAALASATPPTAEAPCAA
jgi:hypothetical protein